MENAKGTPAVEAKAESTNQIAVSHSLEIALSLRKKFCSPRFSKGSLFLARLETDVYCAVGECTHQVFGHFVWGHANAIVCYIQLQHYKND
jgi:hypothetical protein